ncbi:hypothetical protein MLD38_024233 [Melastoma candidum]|uniref:Uncharacterized protein n=1 Tax=Melastoma candidum TaxID=119954 RepID=A0ACB9NUN1_9MYRT|nr:hypothetical protein MLD38_024233 [Melastoma candidum]
MFKKNSCTSAALTTSAILNNLFLLNAVAAGEDLLLVAVAFFLGAGGHLKVGGILWSSDVGVWYPSSTSSSALASMLKKGVMVNKNEMLLAPEERDVCRKALKEMGVWFVCVCAG